MTSFNTCKKSQGFPWAAHIIFDKIQNFNVIPHFHMIFNADFISEAISNF